MFRKAVIVFTLILTICFLVLGVTFKKAADKQKGVGASFGIMMDGQYIENSSGGIGGNRKNYETLNETGTAFYVMGGVAGVICIVSAVSQIKRKGQR